MIGKMSLGNISVGAWHIVLSLLTQENGMQAFLRTSQNIIVAYYGLKNRILPFLVKIKTTGKGDDGSVLSKLSTKNFHFD